MDAEPLGKASDASTCHTFDKEAILEQDESAKQEEKHENKGSIKDYLVSHSNLDVYALLPWIDHRSSM